MRTCGLVLGALVSAASAMASSVAAGDELWGRRVAEVRFAAVEPVDAAALRELLPLRPGDVLVPPAVAEAQRLLLLKGVWSQVEPELVPRRDAVDVVFHLRPIPAVRKIRIRGLQHLGGNEAYRRLHLAPGTLAEPAVLEKAAQRLRELYARRGFDQASVEIRAEPAGRGEVDVTVLVREGEPVRVAGVAFEGDAVFPAEELRSAVAVRPGERYERRLERQAAMAVLAFFRQRSYYAASVSTRWELPAGSRWGVLYLRIRPGPPFDLSFRGNAEFSDAELLGLVAWERRPVVTDGTWRELARRIENAYRERGYHRVRVELEIGSGVPKRVEFRISEGRKYFVRRLRFAGNRALSDRRLRSVMETRARRRWVPVWRGGAFRARVLEEDLQAVLALYRRQGFPAAKVTGTRVDLNDRTGGVEIQIDVDEGPRRYVRRVEFAGFEGWDKLPEVGTRPGAPYDPEQVEADRSALEKAALERGYPEAAVAIAAEDVHAGGAIETDLRFELTPGPYRTIGPVLVQGNALTRDRVILRELPFRPGSPYSAEALREGEARLYRLGLFRTVSVAPVPGSLPERPTVGVRVEERQPGSLQYGFGYNTQLGFRSFAELGYDNLQGMARRVSLRAEFNFDPTVGRPDEYLGNLGFQDPRLFGSRWSSRTNAILQRSVRQVDRFNIERFSLISALERSVSRQLKGGLEAQYDQGTVFGVAPDAAIERVRDEGFLRTFAVGPFALWDRRDDPFSPRRGTFDSLRLRYSAAALGSDVDFFKLVVHHSHYVPLSDSVVFVYALRGGWARPLDGRFTVPIRERFFLGGRTTVRGFDENSIGPRGELGTPRGGDLVGNANAELRFPLWLGFQGAAFADGGGVYLQKQSISLRGFRRSAGLGLRYETPVGPVSLEYGVKLDRRRGEPVGAVHFTIGSIF